MTRIPTLDGWRGIAILIVLIDHFHIVNGSDVPFYSIGQHGVALFFVLSGFLITRILIHEQETSGAISLRAFYLRRFLRLAPAAICYLILVRVFLGVHDFPACLLFYRNYIPGSPLTAHFWSLSLEEQFYLVWPLLLSLLRPSRALWVALPGAAAVAAWRHLMTPTFTFVDWWVTLRTEYRADALLVGCAVAILMRDARLRDAIARLPLWLALGAFAGCIWHYRLIVPLWESILIALLLGRTSMLSRSHTVHRILEWAPLAWLGCISYSVYLWQQLPALVFAHSRDHLLIRIAVLAALALISYYVIELPFRRLRLAFRRTPAAGTAQSM